MDMDTKIDIDVNVSIQIVQHVDLNISITINTHVSKSHRYQSFVGISGATEEGSIPCSRLGSHSTLHVSSLDCRKPPNPAKSVAKNS